MTAIMFSINAYENVKRKGGLAEFMLNGVIASGQKKLRHVIIAFSVIPSGFFIARSSISTVSPKPKNVMDTVDISPFHSFTPG